MLRSGGWMREHFDVKIYLLLGTLVGHAFDGSEVGVLRMQAAGTAA